MAPASLPAATSPPSASSACPASPTPSCVSSLPSSGSSHGFVFWLVLAAALLVLAATAACCLLPFCWPLPCASSDSASTLLLQTSRTGTQRSASSPAAARCPPLSLSTVSLHGEHSPQAAAYAPHESARRISSLCALESLSHECLSVVRKCQQRLLARALACCRSKVSASSLRLCFGKLS